jgi:rhodanese-related sulfurtransferase
MSCVKTILAQKKEAAMNARSAVAGGLLALVVAGLAIAQEKLTHTSDSLAEVKKNVEAGKAVIVDVREPSETDAGYVKGAILLPQSKLKVESELAALLKTLPKDKVIYTHCRAGGRALTCGDILKKQGFDVRPLKPGYQQLIEAGFEKAK